MLVSCLVYSSDLKMKATCPSKTSVDFQWTTQLYDSEDRTSQNHCCDKLRSYDLIMVQMCSGLDTLESTALVSKTVELQFVYNRGLLS
jgi:hypothetical protein